MNTVLVLADDPEFRSTLRRQLEAAGFGVIDVRRGVDALRLLDNGHSVNIRAVVLDLDTPGASGVIHDLRDRYPALPVVVIVEKVDTDLRDVLDEIGIRAVVRQADRDELLAALERVLREPPEHG